MKIRPMEAQLFHADRQAEMTKLIVAFCYLAKALKNACRCVTRKPKETGRLEEFGVIFRITLNNKLLIMTNSTHFFMYLFISCL
jgi:hypothetical protein